MRQLGRRDEVVHPSQKAQEVKHAFIITWSWQLRKVIEWDFVETSKICTE